MHTEAPPITLSQNRQLVTNEDDLPNTWPKLILWSRVAYFYNIASVTLRGLFYIFILKDVVKVLIANLLLFIGKLVQFLILLVK